MYKENSISYLFINLYVESYNLTPDEFDNMLIEERKKSFTVSHVNIRSLNRNIDQLRLLYEQCLESKIHLVGVSEIWNVSSLDALGMNGYDLEVSCRDPTLRGGGVGAYIHSSVNYKTLHGNVIHAESLWLEISLDKQSTIIGIIYRKPNTDVAEFQDIMIHTLKSSKLIRN